MARRSEHTRQELKELALQAAIKLAQEQGLSGLTARKIAAEMGYTPGTLYLIFENLDELILHVNAQTLDNIYESMQSQLQLTDPAGQEVHRLVDAYIQFATNNRGLWSCLHEHKSASKILPDWYDSRISRNFNLLEHALYRVSTTEVVQLSWATSDQNKQEASIQLVAKALWCGIHGVCVSALNSTLSVADIDSMGELVHHLTEISLRSLGVVETKQAELHVPEINSISC
ncbi:hypothetical protein MNBD_GAMMA12-55 [hydrothermal vent metagenome]|uniref:HTH tetR-type domain-containing protein n=1 Tax=hydrothermal vent metagenome TaxID=652676 RepID=A0A3B0YV91_9ZZZZ